MNHHGLILTIWMVVGQNKLEVEQRDFTREFQQLKTGEFVADIGTTHVHFQRRVAHRSVAVVKEVMKNVEDASLGEDQFLQILWMEIVTVHVHC